MGALDFFLLESGDYLEQLDALAQGQPGQPPNPDDFLRLTRAFRGSALMANQQSMGRAAQGLESVARAVRERRLAWDERVRGEVIRAVDDCKVVLRRLRTPEQGDSEKAEQIGINLDRLSGRASAAMRAAQGSGLDAGGRAFVAREAAGIASTLQHAATTLAAEPANRDVLNAVTPSMSALRGVAAIQDLPPLADLLAAIEAAVKEVLAIRGRAPRDVADVFNAGGQALARAAKEVVDQGRPDPESRDAQTFAQRLIRTFAGGHVVPVESLFYDDAGPHILTEGTPPERTTPEFDRLEMVSQGEFLTAATAELRRAAANPVQCDLRLFTIAARLRPMVGADGTPLAAALGQLAEAARDAIGRGAAVDALDEFVALIGHAAEALQAAQRGDDGLLAERLQSAASGLAALQGPPPPKAAGTERTTRPLQRGGVAQTPRQFAPAPPPAAAVPAAAVPTAPGVPAVPAAAFADAQGLAASYLTLEQLIADRGLPLTSIDELVGAPTTMPAAAAAPAALAAPAAPAALAAPAAPAAPAYGSADADEALAPGRSTGPRAHAENGEETEVVPVDALLYRGERALRRALELRGEIDAIYAASGNGDPRLKTLLREVFDLVELGLDTSR